MRQSVTLTLVALAGPALMASSPIEDGMLRYRGEYTYGHEVNIFCPSINSQCYWVGGTTADEVRVTLRQFYAAFSDGPYDPICVVIEGRIDREAERSGFAADFDGFISVAGVFGMCDETDIVTHGDLQHHRWVLVSINGQAVSLGEDGMTPELDFGEQMTVTGSSGCNRFSGQAALRGEHFVIEGLASTRRMCGELANEVEGTVLRVLGSESSIKLDSERSLTLESDQAVLRFRLDDWKK